MTGVVAADKVAAESSVVKSPVLDASVDAVAAAVVVDAVAGIVAELLALLLLRVKINAGVPKLLGTALVEDSKF